MIALRSFLKYLSKRDVVSLAPEKIELAKQSMRQVEFLEPDELARLLDVPLKDVTFSRVPLVRFRNKAILEFLFSTGLRVSEAANLSIERLNLKRDEFTVKGKGGKMRVVFLSILKRARIRFLISL
ncbi:MAG: Tyrosine recombinase XerC [Candidatus Uhrbacteria bacterium GW2011_GWC2_53_7]|uniref:Tyrosine recombinase XerC n=1 Tax=Candidatus Uhrbacteria bacterium GW2011_GWC2_53_7 TaxID=1618986 RepID=A0A0G2A7V8_9BACT|nr:MAG: Tyrosine recombinase XerC [Candidatus Uhrbacteria bacterium GW2011_GWC2_53_7]